MDERWDWQYLVDQGSSAFRGVKKMSGAQRDRNPWFGTGTRPLPVPPDQVAAAYKTASSATPAPGMSQADACFVALQSALEDEPEPSHPVDLHQRTNAPKNQMLRADAHLIANSGLPAQPRLIRSESFVDSGEITALNANLHGPLEAPMPPPPPVPVLRAPVPWTRARQPGQGETGGYAARLQRSVYASNFNPIGKKWPKYQ
jgi:hypothetical protein